MLRLAFGIRASLPATAAGLALIAAAGAHATEPLLGGGSASLGNLTPAALAILAEARQGPSLGERFGLPRSSGPAALGLPPLIYEPVLASPLNRHRRQPAGPPR